MAGLGALVLAVAIVASYMLGAGSREPEISELIDEVSRNAAHIEMQDHLMKKCEKPDAALAGKGAGS